MKQLLSYLFFLLLLLPGARLQAQRRPVPYDSLRQVLENIYDIDQGIRQKISTAKPEEKGALFQQMRQVDSVNQIQVNKILGRYGWLPQSKIGKKAAEGLFFVVQHAPVSTIEKYLPSLQKLAAHGEANQALTAMMEDRLLMYKGQKQRYGTQATSLLRQDGSMAIWPIQEPEIVNQLRKDVGLTGTVEENAKRMNAVYDPKEALPTVKYQFH